MSDNNYKTALVTGATSGIGMATALTYRIKWYRRSHDGNLSR